jgi:hypothetical protein
MKRPTFFLILAATVAATGGTIYEARMASHDRESIAAARKQIVQLEQQLATLRREEDAVVRELAAAPAGAADVPAPLPAGHREAARERDVTDWLAQVKQLEQTFADHPDQRIPEMALLTDLDWLALARARPLGSESDLRRARAQVRELAKEKFLEQLREALRSCEASSGGMLPTDILQLLPHFKVPVDPAMLQRYEMVASGPLSANRGEQAIAERAPIDRGLDRRVTVSADGRGSAGTPWAVESLSQAARQAVKEFAAAHNGRQPANEAELLPYVNDPAARAIFSATVEFEKERGRATNGLADLRPYVKDPAAQALLEQVIAAQNPDGKP